MSFLGNIGKALGGGNIMGLALGAASMFFPPLGLAAGAMGNLMGNAIGQAVGGAVGQMVQNMGMPNMVGNLIKQVVGEALGKLQQQVGKEVQDQVGQKFEGWLKDFQQQFMRDLLQEMEKLVGKPTAKPAAGGAPATGGAPAAGGAAGGAAAANGAQSIDQIASQEGVSWFVAVAIALGKAADKQMHKVKDLADQMNSAVTNTKGHSGDDLQKDGMEFQKIGAQMNAESKVLEIITATMNNTVKSVGDALASAAKRQ